MEKVGWSSSSRSGARVDVEARQARGAIVAALLLWIAIPAWGGATLDRVAANGILRIGHRDASIPFSYVPQPGAAPVGYAVELCGRIADMLKRELKRPDLKTEFVLVTSGTRMTMVAEGKVDLPPGSMEYIDDLTGKGHTTRTTSKEERVSIWLKFEDQKQRIGPLNPKTTTSPKP